jgi:hypothetical protein
VERRYPIPSNDGSKQRSHTAAVRLLGVVFTWSRTHDWVTGAIAGAGLWLGAADHVAIEGMAPQFGEIKSELHGIKQEIALRSLDRSNEIPRQPTAAPARLMPQAVAPPPPAPQAVLPAAPAPQRLAPPPPAPQAVSPPAPTPQAGFPRADIMAHPANLTEANLTLRCYGRVTSSSEGLPRFFDEMATCLSEGGQ